MQYSSTQSQFLPLCHFLRLLSNFVAFHLSERYFHVSPFTGSCQNFCVAFRKSCKDFYIMKSNGLNNKMPWNHDFVTSNLFLYLMNVFMQYHWNRYYCKLKALFSPQRSPPQSVPSDSLMCDDSKCFQCMPAFTIWYSASNDDGKCYKNTAFLERLVRFILYLYSLNTRFENTAFHFWVILLYSVTTYISLNIR